MAPIFYAMRRKASVRAALTGIDLKSPALMAEYRSLKFVIYHLVASCF
ncbi:hypothetical protein [Camelimonas lactis]|nr:hypothetical protein [Camelimonas lactis]